MATGVVMAVVRGGDGNSSIITTTVVMVGILSIPDGGGGHDEANGVVGAGEGDDVNGGRVWRRGLDKMQGVGPNDKTYQETAVKHTHLDQGRHWEPSSIYCVF